MDHFPILILIGRPASGKSEIIDYLVKADPGERLRRYHVGTPDVLDDFEMLWAWFEEDHILERSLGKPRLHTDSDGYFLDESLWHLLIERLSLEYRKRQRDPLYHQTHTTIVEFSRGSEHGGYAKAFEHLSDETLAQAAILYVRVSFSESLRKNRRRFNPELPDSILEHSLPDAKLERLYKEDDWKELTGEGQTEDGLILDKLMRDGRMGDKLKACPTVGGGETAGGGVLMIRGQRVPYAVFENEDDVTSGEAAGLPGRLEETLAELWKIRTVR